MNTKERILDEALTLFAEKGYTAVYVGDIAAAVGIKAPSLYKHYKSKRDIFQAILDRMQESYNAQAQQLRFTGMDPGSDAAIFSKVPEDALVELCLGLFRYFLHDSYSSRFRKMLTLEQFQDGELAQLYTAQYADQPLAYQSALFRLLWGREDPSITALHFYAPIYMMLTICDRHPEREPEAIKTLEAHIRQFNRLYTGGSNV